MCDENVGRNVGRKCVTRTTCITGDNNSTFYQICVVGDCLSQLHFNSKPRQTSGSCWESFIEFRYQFWRPYHDGKIVFEWSKNGRKSENFKFKRFKF